MTSTESTVPVAAPPFNDLRRAPASVPPASDDLRAEVEACLDARVRPLLRVHGGSASVASIDDGVVRIQFEGLCRGCVFRPTTIAALVEPALRSVDGIRAVDGGARVSAAAAARLAQIYPYRDYAAPADPM